MSRLGEGRRLLDAYVENGADVNAISEIGQPIHIAALLGHSNVVKFLLENGAVTTVKDDQGNLPIDIAKKYNFAPIVTLLENQSRPRLRFKAQRIDDDCPF